MKKKAYKELLKGAAELGAALKGDMTHVTRITRIDPDSVAAIRVRMKMSQSQFASAIGISIDTLQNWEQGRTQPSGPARILLRVAARHPQAVLEAVA